MDEHECKGWKAADRVTYRPLGSEIYPERWEYGVVVRHGAGNIVFVRYDGDKHAKGTYCHRLYHEIQPPSTGPT